MKCPSCKVDFDLHGIHDYESCLRRLASVIRKLKKKAASPEEKK